MLNFSTGVRNYFDIINLMLPGTVFTFNVDAGAMLIAIIAFFFALLAVVWKGKSEIHGAIKADLDPLQKNISAIISAIVEIHTVLKEKFRGLNITHTLIEKGSSPLKPTEYGGSLVKDSGLEKVLDDHNATLCVKLKAVLPAGYTEYDVQEKARQLLVELKDDPMMNPVKDWVYNHPMDIEVILRAGGLWLRDDFLGHPRQVIKET